MISLAPFIGSPCVRYLTINQQTCEIRGCNRARARERPVAHIEIYDSTGIGAEGCRHLTSRPNARYGFEGCSNWAAAEHPRGQQRSQRCQNDSQKSPTSMI